MVLNINSEIIDEYLKTGHLDRIKQNEIYKAIVPGEYKFEKPTDVDLELLGQLYKKTKEKLVHFKPLNHDLWVRIFGPTQIPDDVTIYLIVGAPKGYEAFVRKDSNGNRYIIIDLALICTYSNDIEQLDFIIFDFITHEVAHALVSLKYPYSDQMSNLQLLKQLMFDEGIAHFLSYKKDVLALKWHTERMEKYRKAAYEKLNHYLNHIDEFTFDLLKQANSGDFWDKFVSISGMFAIVEYCEKGGSLENLLSDGPDLLIEYIIKPHAKQ